VASARGAFRVDNAQVRGNGTLFSGARVETAAVPGELALNTGERVTLGSNSSAKVFPDRVVLERGEGSIGKVPGSASKFGVEAGMLRVVADEAGGAGRVRMAGTDRVLVASTSGKLRVLTAAGVPLASVSAGRVLEFDTKAVNSGAMRLTGRMTRSGGKLMLTDEGTDLTVELRQGKLPMAKVEKSLGKRVEVAGIYVPGSMPMALQVEAVGAVQTANGTPGVDPGAGAGAGTGGASAGDAAGGAAAGGDAGGVGGAVGTGSSFSANTVVTGVLITVSGVGAGVGITRALKDDEPKPISQ
jgi:hypothetical protein